MTNNLMVATQPIAGAASCSPKIRVGLDERQVKRIERKCKVQIGLACEFSLPLHAKPARMSFPKKVVSVGLGVCLVSKNGWIFALGAHPCSL